MKGFALILLVPLFLTTDAFSQRIMGYFPAYRNALAGTIEYAKMTDVVFAFMNFNPANGDLDLTNEPQLDNLIAAARAAKPNIRIHISSGGGGYGGGGQFPTMINNAAARANYVSQMANLIQAKNLDGWDLDWEYPQTTAEKNNHETLITDMRIALNAKQSVMCKKLDVSIAVGALMHTSPPDTWKVNPNTMNYVDNVLIMAYDGGPGVAGDPHHSSYNFAQEALDGWNAWGLPYSKMMLGVPFYGWIPYFTAAQTYGAIDPGNQAAVFNTDYYNGYYYNGAPTLRNKIDLAMRTGQKTQGIMIWELGQDVIGGPYSLLNAIYQKLNSDYAVSPNPPNPCTLPVEFLDFSGIKSNDQVALRWTVNEINSDYFDVEKSLDGKTFVKIKTVKSLGTTSANTLYECTDEVGSGNADLFYRIAQYDLDKKVSYSITICVSQEEESEIYIYPQPVLDAFYLQCGSAFSGTEEIYLALKDINGREVLHTEIFPEEENYLPLHNLKPGVYIAYLHSERKVVIRKITKL